MPRNFDLNLNLLIRFMPTTLFSKLLLIPLLFTIPSAAHAQQTSDAEELPTVQVSALEIGNLDLPPLYWKQITFNEEGDPVESFNRLPVSSGSRGGTTDITLLAPTHLYTGTFGPEGEPNMQPVVEIPAEGADDRFLVVFFHDANGQVIRKVIDDSAESHPAGSVRLINCSPTRLVFNVGGENKVDPPDGDSVAEPVVNDTGRFPFVYFTNQAGRVVRAPSKLLRLRDSNARLLVVYGNLREENETGEVKPDGSPVTEVSYAPIAYRLYDSISLEN